MSVTEEEQLKQAACRVEKNGLKNAMTFDRLIYLKVKAANLRIDKHNEHIETVTALYNRAAYAGNAAMDCSISI